MIGVEDRGIAAAIAGGAQKKAASGILPDSSTLREGFIVKVTRAIRGYLWNVDHHTRPEARDPPPSSPIGRVATHRATRMRLLNPPRGRWLGPGRMRAQATGFDGS